jgi:hypothetical protein
MYILKEAITKSYIDTLHKDTLMFLKNIKRIQTPKQLLDLYLEWGKWLASLRIKIGQNMMGHLTLDTLPDISASIPQRKYIEWMKDADWFFVPTKLEYTRAIKTYTDVYFLPYTTFINRLDADDMGEFDYWDLAYRIFNDHRQSKYVSLKKKIDELFKLIEVYENKAEYYQTDTIKIDSVKVDLEYSDSTKALLPDIIDNIKRAFGYIKSAKFGKVLSGSNFVASLTSLEAKNINPNGADLGVGGYYNPRTGLVKLLYSRLFVKNPDETITAIVHEYGHKFYFEYLPSSQQKEWEKFYSDLINNKPTQGNNITRLVLKAFEKAKQDLKQTHNKLSMNVLDVDAVPLYYKNPVELVKNVVPKQYLSLVQDLTGAPARETIATLVARAISSADDEKLSLVDGHGTLPIRMLSILEMTLLVYLQEVESRSISLSINFPTKYATVNPSEFFAETFTAYVLWKTPFAKNYKFTQPVFEYFLDITHVRGNVFEKARGKSCIY